jgi:2-dehydropantoate 2-reductase
VFGGFLRMAGHEVTLLGRGEHLDAIAERGLFIEGLWGDHHAGGCELCSHAGAARGAFDAILITVKSYETQAMARAVAPLLAADGLMISLQNGLGNGEALAAAVGSRRVLAGRVIFGAEVVAPGRVRVTVYADPVLVGAWDMSGSGSRSRESGAGSRLSDSEDGMVAPATQGRRWVANFAAAGIPAEYTEDIVAALWGKVLYNAALNPLGALLGVHYGALGEDADTRAIMNAVIDETFAVAIAEGVKLPWNSAADYRAVFYGRLIPPTFHHRSSMLQDLERGRPTEIDAINGAVWQRGVVHGILTPFNELLARLVHARQALAGGVRR